MATKLDPWGAVRVSDYKKLFKEFGLKEFDNSKYNLKFRLFRRGQIIAHRDFDKIFAAMKTGKFINMTGIASSGHMHFGHKLIVDSFNFFTKYTKHNYFGVANIDAYVSRPKIKSMDEANKYAYDNLLDVLALGLNEKDIGIQSQMGDEFFTFSHTISKKITENMFKAIYGHLDVGKISAVLLQLADILYLQLRDGKMPSITGIGLEQDPHLRLTRDIAARLNLAAPCSLYPKHLSGLKEGKKMSSSEPNTAIFLRDNPKLAEKKVKRSFTGGRETLEIQKQKGGRPEICKIYEMMVFHMGDDKKLSKIFSDCKAGKLMCGDCKQICADFVVDFLKQHQKKREKMRKVADKLLRS